MVISEKIKTAKKQHMCDACDAILSYGGEPLTFTKKERKYFNKAKKNGFKISVGQKYLKQVSVIGEDLVLFRAEIKVHAICLKYKIYES